MMESGKVALAALCSIMLGVASASAQATLLKWTLTGVKFSEYNPFSFHPKVQGSFDMTGWFIVDTQAKQITDWKFAPGRLSRDTPCLVPDNATGCNTAQWEDDAFIGSARLSVFNEPVRTVQGAQSFKFQNVCSGACLESLDLVALTGHQGIDEAGGAVQLAAGSYQLTYLNTGAFLTGGSLIGTVVPEQKTFLYLLAAAGLFGLRPGAISRIYASLVRLIVALRAFTRCFTRVRPAIACKRRSHYRFDWGV